MLDYYSDFCFLFLAQPQLETLEITQLLHICFSPQTSSSKGDTTLGTCTNVDFLSLYSVGSLFLFHHQRVCGPFPSLFTLFVPRRASVNSTIPEMKEEIRLVQVIVKIRTRSVSETVSCARNRFLDQIRITFFFFFLRPETGTQFWGVKHEDQTVDCHCTNMQHTSTYTPTRMCTHTHTHSDLLDNHRCFPELYFPLYLLFLHLNETLLNIYCKNAYKHFDHVN